METPFNERGVAVTRNALTAAGQIFMLRDIVDVRVELVRKNRVVPIALSVLGVAGAVAGAVAWSPAALVCGVMLAVVGWLAWTTQDVMHRLVVETSSGDREALASLDRDFVVRVEQAVRQAQTAPAASGVTKP
jgi:hypothetical protein